MPCRAQAATSSSTSGPGHVDGVLPQPLPQLVPAREARGVVRPAVGRVQRHERLGQHRELGAAARRLAEQPHRLLHRRLRVEDHRRGLDRGHPHGAQLGHRARRYGPRAIPSTAALVRSIGGQEAGGEAEEALLQVQAALQALPRRVQAAGHAGLAVKRDDGRFVLAKELRKKQLKAARA